MAEALINILISFTMIVFGLLFIKKPPSKINYIYGYRTQMSMKNKDTWNFAHRYAGKVWLISGVVTLIISLILVLSLQDQQIYQLAMYAMVFKQTVVLVAVIPITEIALRKNFDKSGIRKQKQ